MGIWIENGTITSEPGYVIVYNWDKEAQPNDGYSAHIGFWENGSMYISAVLFWFSGIKTVMFFLCIAGS